MKDKKSEAVENDYWAVLVKIANRRPYGSTYGGSAFLKSRQEAREVLRKHCDDWKKSSFRSAIDASNPKTE